MGKVVGIDLGTTFSAIAHINDFGKEEIIQNAQGERITPSVILFEDDNITVGTSAKQQAKAMPDQTVEFVKRQMGKSKGNGENEYSYEFDGKVYSAEELSAQILLKLKQDAEAILGTEITDAVITVPAYFKDAERHATRLAGEIAGLNILQIVNEPTAAALAFGLDLHGSDQTVFVFDLGGGTFDVTIMKVSGSKLEMIASDGDHRLGGKDWDDRIIEYVADAFETEHRVNPLDDEYAYQDIQLNAISAKVSLSDRDRAKIVCSHDGNKSIVEVTREKFEELTADLIDKCRDTCELVLSDAEMTWSDIDVVLLVGGSTRMPMVREMIEDISGKQINPMEVNPDDAVALGAAVQGVLRQLEEVVIEGQSDTTKEEDIAPAVKDRFLTSGGELAVKVVDAATHNLGLVPLNAQGEAYIHVMIPKMTPVPCEVVDEFGTSKDNQTSVLVEVVQGLEQDKLKEEITDFEQSKIGECLLEGLPPNEPKGSPIIVTYKYNLDQTLEVTVEGKGGVVANATIDRPTLDAAEAAEASTHLQQNLNVE